VISKRREKKLRPGFVSLFSSLWADKELYSENPLNSLLRGERLAGLKLDTCDYYIHCHPSSANWSPYVSSFHLLWG